MAAYRAEGKRSVVGAILAFFGPVRLGPGPAFHEAALKSTGLFKYFNQMLLDDVLTGTRGDRVFALAEAELVSNSRISSKTVFRGLILAAKLRDPIDPPVAVVPRRDWLGGLFGGPARDMKLSEMRGDHAVKGSSMEQVRRCLSPAVRALIRRLSARAGAGNFGLCFCGDRLYVKIRQEANLLESLTDIEMAPTMADVKKIVREIHELLSLADAVDAALDRHETAPGMRT
ncbi:MAG: DUF3137 domain-containing protein [Alphaproteobacteria bacterium]|nr:DUF3137 domain-containing protein [Alphaproteobacteria bacterium]